MDPQEGDKAAHDLARLTMNTSSAEDAAAAKAGAMEGLSHVLINGAPAASMSAASALANLVANAGSNKVTLCKIPGVLVKLVGLLRGERGGQRNDDDDDGMLAERGQDSAVRAMLNIVSSREACAAVLEQQGAVESVCELLRSPRRNPRDDAARVINVIVSHGKRSALAVGSCEGALQAIIAQVGWLPEPVLRRMLSLWLSQGVVERFVCVVSAVQLNNCLLS